MREIKFRYIWEIEQSYGKPFLIKSHIFTLDEIESGKITEVLEDYNLSSNSLPKDKLQFIGLHDKNRKEIYEGDLVKFRGVSADEVVKDFIGKVGYRNNSFVIFYEAGWENYSAPRELEHWLGEKIEVIGNIYENPDLIK